MPKTPRPLGLSQAEAKELQAYMLNQYLDKNRWPALARLLTRLQEVEPQESEDPAFHTEIA